MVLCDVFDQLNWNRRQFCCKNGHRLIDLLVSTDVAVNFVDLGPSFRTPIPNDLPICLHVNSRVEKKEESVT